MDAETGTISQRERNRISAARYRARRRQEKEGLQRQNEILEARVAELELLMEVKMQEMDQRIAAMEILLEEYRDEAARQILKGQRVMRVMQAVPPYTPLPPLLTSTDARFQHTREGHEAQ